MINRQFDFKLIKNRQTWKTQEYWPDNKVLKSQPGPNVFLICNPFFNPEVLHENLAVAENTCKILLYTDLKLQLRLAWEKQAYWFTDISRKQFQAPAANQKYIRKIINDHRPMDPMIEKIKNVFVPDVTIRLEDFIALKTVPGGIPTQDQINFLNYWYGLQSDKSHRLLNRQL